MEFRTSQGGETTLVFDEGERLQLEDIAKRQRLHYDQIVLSLSLQRQADPLADFDQLLQITFPQMFTVGGLVPAKKRKTEPQADPLQLLEQDIRRRLAQVTGTPIGSTSQTMQVEALLLQALSVCLAAQEARRRERGDA